MYYQAVQKQCAELHCACRYRLSRRGRKRAFKRSSRRGRKKTADVNCWRRSACMQQEGKCVRIPLHPCIYTHTLTHKYTRVCIHTGTQAQTHLHTHTHTLAHTHTHEHTHTPTQTPQNHEPAGWQGHQALLHQLQVWPHNSLCASMEYFTSIWWPYTKYSTN
jgi:hypothetical protein